MIIVILLIFALVCFALNAFGQPVGSLNLDAAGKAFLVAALLVYLH